jgi:lysozyme
MAELLNVIIDVSHHNGNPDFAQAAAAGIVGVIHKATQGLTYEDPMYTTNRQKALDPRAALGAYHFGVGGDGAAQADFFLATVNPGARHAARAGLRTEYARRPRCRLMPRVCQ